MVGDHPIKWCVVSSDEVIVRGNRLDASAYNVEARNAKARVQGGKLLSELMSNAYYPGRFKRIYCAKGNGEGFYLPSQLTDVYPKPDKYISILTDCDISELRLTPNTLLLTRSGTIGTIGYASKTLVGKVFSDDVIRVKFKSDNDLGFVYAYLKSRVGNLMLTMNGYGSVITHLEPEHLNSIPIPEALEEIKRKITDLVVRSYELRDESNALIDKATAMMMEALKLPPVDEMLGARPPINVFSVSSDDLAGRLDASYHVPIVKAITDHLKRHAAEVTTIADPLISRDVILPPRFARVYVEKVYGRPLIGGKQINELDPSNKKFLSNLKHKGILSQLEVHTNTTLITRSGTVGKVALVPRHWDRWIPSDHIIRIVPANNDIAGYLNIYLSSEYAHPLIVRYTYGAVIDEIDDIHVRNIPVPLLKDKGVQGEINALALAANEKRFEAYNLEQQALAVMESEVLCPTKQGKDQGIK